MSHTSNYIGHIVEEDYGVQCLELTHEQANHLMEMGHMDLQEYAWDIAGVNYARVLPKAISRCVTPNKAQASAIYHLKKKNPGYKSTCLSWEDDDVLYVEFSNVVGKTVDVFISAYGDTLIQKGE